jgi:hypothetical protein
VYWIHPGEDKDKWWAFLYTLTNTWVRKMHGIWVAEETIAFQQGLCCMQLVILFVI